ncbi:MAG: hypothetical protein AAGA76_12970 [Pseudomonadota bacterium]
MFLEIFLDSTRFIHFVGFALGIGAGSFGDFSVLRKLNVKITEHDLSTLDMVHKIVWLGVGLLWLSGLMLLYLKTGFQPSEFTAKLFMKLMVVTVLTINAVMMGAIAMPIMRRNLKRAYMEFSLEDKAILGLLGAISICSWISGLVLGIFSALKPAEFYTIMPMFAFMYLGALVAAMQLTIILHVIWERRQSKFADKPQARLVATKTNQNEQVSENHTWDAVLTSP